MEETKHESKSEETKHEHASTHEHTADAHHTDEPVEHAVTSDLASHTMSRIKNKQTILWIVLAVVIIAVLAGLAFKYKQLVIAAVVDKHPITRFSVIHELERRGGKDTLDLLISKQLIKAEAAAKHITVSDEEVNKEIKKYEDIYNVQGNTLDATLAAQGLSRDDLKKQVIIQKDIEKLLGDKAVVSDDEVAKYITDNKIPLPQGKEDATKADIKEQLRQQKIGELADQLVSDLKAKAKIRTYIKY